MFRKVAAVCGLGLLSLLVVLAVGCSSVAPTPLAQTDQPRRRGVDGARVLKVGDVPQAEGWYKLQFLNEKDGWLAGSKNLWRTRDGGATWAPVDLGGTELGELKSFRFLDSEDGWLLRGERLYRTADGGGKWTPVKLPPAFSGGEIRDVSFLSDGKTGWIVGGTYRPARRHKVSDVPNNVISPDSKSILNGAIFRTDDGGETWVRQTISARSFRILKLKFFDESSGLALSDARTFYTGDGGRRWAASDFREDCVNQNNLDNSEGHPADVYFVNAGTGWLSYTDGYVAKTTDGGRTWCDLTRLKDLLPKASYDTYFLKLHFADEAHGWGLVADGALLETNDGGATWAGLNTGHKFDDMYFTDVNHVWAVAKDGLYKITSSPGGGSQGR